MYRVCQSRSARLERTSGLPKFLRLCSVNPISTMSIGSTKPTNCARNDPSTTLLASTPSFDARGHGRQPSARVPTGTKIFLISPKSICTQRLTASATTARKPFRMKWRSMWWIYSSKWEAMLDLAWTRTNTRLLRVFENMQKYGKDVEVTLKLACKKFGSEVQ